MVETLLPFVKKRGYILYFRLLSIFFFTNFCINTSFSQGSQDCLGAISVCQNTYTQSSSFSGFGSNQEIFNTCLANNEQASVWYKFTVQVGGSFGFNINTLNDYDWALYDLTGTSCANIPNLTPVRCNFSAQFGNTGLSLPSSGTASISDGAGASPFTAGINTIAGRTYALVIDNYTQDLNGYTLSFTGTASFIDNTAPAMTNLTDNCYQNYVTLTLSEPIQCSSISAGGSDFLISGPGSPTITGAAGVGCPAGGTTNQVMVYYNATGTGSFTLTSKVGNDGNTLLDICGNTLPVGQSLSFNHLGTVTATASPYTICAGGSSTLTATSGSISGASYTWVPTTALSSSTTIPVTATPSVTSIYTLSITYGGCTKSDTARVFVNSAPIASISPLNSILCSGSTVNLTATSTINGVPCVNCNYNWNSGTYTQSNVVSSVYNNQGVGTYNVVATSPLGCQSSVSTTTISSPSNPPTGAACNVIYASPSGSGSGLVNTSPTSLANAITMAQCSNSIIKLAVGTYTLSNTLTIGSLMTLEGGYVNNFGQKVSTDGTPLTTSIIYRDDSNIQGLPTVGRIVALDATGASYFRLQDITIQTANAPLATVTNPYGISTYALYLNSCSNYDLVRCRILSGNASAGLPGNSGSNGSDGGDGGTGTAGDPDAEGNNLLGGSMGFSACGCSGGEGGRNRSPGSGTSSTDGSTITCSGLEGTIGLRGVNDRCDPFSCSNPDDGGNGGDGGDGANGLNGTSGSAGLVISNYWTPGNQAANGTNGTPGGGGGGGGGGAAEVGSACDDGSGSSGSGGGGGGCPGIGGTGGYGGGSAYSVFIVSNGANGRITDCSITPGAFGPGGIGGAGGVGGIGGQGGPRINADCDVGDGGAGGDGGDGGDGGNGGNGSNGESIAVKLVNGTALSQNTTLNLVAQPVITVDNIACTNTNITHSTGATSPAWFSFGTFATPNNAFVSPVVVQFSTTGRKTITMNGNNYTGFTNIIIDNPTSTLSIVNSSNTVCPGTYNFQASTFGQSGFTYSWTVSASTPTGGTSSIASATAGQTNITFGNTTGGTITFTVSLTITSACCGVVGTITKVITVYGPPTLTNPINFSICNGGNATFSSIVTGTGLSYQWQESTNSGATWSNISLGSIYSGVTTASLGITGVTSAMNGYLYRLVVTDVCGTYTTTSASLTIKPQPTATISASDNTLCGATNQSATVSINFTGTAPWSVTYSTNNGTITSSTVNNINTNPYTFTFNTNASTQNTSYTITSVSDANACPNTTVSGTSINVVGIAPNVITTNPAISCSLVNISLPAVTAGSVTDGPLQYWSSYPSPATALSNPTAVGSGTYYISNTNACGTSFAPVTVTVSPPVTVSVSGSTIVCGTVNTTLTANVNQTGGTYLWSNGATTSSISVSPASTTSYTVTYSYSNCTPATAPGTITVNSAPTISGTLLLCTIGTTSLTGSGTPASPNAWTSSNTSVATVPTSAANTVTVTGIGVGSTTITYTDATGCTKTAVVTISNPTITGTLSLCSIGATSQLTGSGTANGTNPWISSAPGVATVSNTGLVTSVAAGTTTITYTDINNCTRTAIVTVSNPVVSGTLTTCVGASTQLSGTGTASPSTPWISATTSVATVNGAGLVTGVAAGTSVITYMDVNGCTRTATVTVSALPNITGTTTLCTGATSQLTGSGTPNGTNPWVSSAVGVATVSNTGLVTAISAGTTTITYTDINGCTRTATVTVNAGPNVTGTLTLCVGTSTTLTGTGTPAASSTWVSNNVSTATVTGSTVNGLVNAVAAGTASIIYTDINGCSRTVTFTVTPAPTISGSLTICATGTTTLTGSGTPAITGTWTSSNLGVATITGTNSTTGTITPVAAGTTTITYTDISGCQRAVTLTVTAAPTVSITPSSTTACSGTATTLTSTVNPSGGTYSWSNAATTANISPSPVATTTYTLSYTQGTCQAVIATATITVRPAPTATISGTTTVCQNGTSPNVTFSNPGTLDVIVSYTINSGATQTIGVSAGSTAVVAAPTSANGTFVYNIVSVSYTSAPACPNVVSGSATITVTQAPTATISGPTSVCQNATAPVITFTNPRPIDEIVTYTLNGTSTTITAPANSTNTVTVPTGTATTYTYSLVSVVYSGSSSCSATISGSVAITVNPAPTATITGTTTVCQGSPQSTVTLTNSNSSAAILTYNTGGANSTVTLAGFATQTFNVPTTSATTVTYNLVGVAFSGGTGCSAVLSSSATVTVTAGPSATISGTTSVCQGATAPTITFTNPTSAPITVTYNINSGTTDFTININGNTSNTVTVPTGTSGTFTYNLESVVFQSGSPCLAIITGSATVTVSPTNTVSTPSSSPTVCLNSAITPITITTTGATGIGTATGLPTGVAASFSGNTITISGTPTASGTFNYSIPLTGGCGTVNATGTITVRPAPTVTISGTATVCQNGTAPSITFTNPGLADVIVSYTINGGATQTIAVSAGLTATVTAPTAANGTFVYNLVSVVYTNAPTCSTALSGSATITVTQAPTATISGPTSVCQNATSPVITFTNPRPIDEIVTYTLNGVSATITVAANSTNTVTVPTGTATTYTYALVSVVYSGSGSCSATLSGSAVITVNPAPTATVTGTTTVCQGSAQPTVTFTNTQSSAVVITYNTGGANSSFSLPAFGTQGFNVPTTTATTVTYNLVGVAYSGGTGCSAVLNSSATVTVSSGPTATITGTTTVCQGATAPTITFTNPTSAPITVTYNINFGTTDFTINIPASSTNTVTVPTTTSGTFTYNLETVIFQTGSPCLATISGNATVTISSNNTVSLASSNPTVCIGTAITPVTFTTTGAAGIGAPTGLPTGVSAVMSGNTITVSGTPTQSGTFNYSIPLSGGCSTVNATGTITVNPVPTVTLSGTTAVCQDDNPPLVTFTNPQNQAITVTYSITGGPNANVNIAANSSEVVALPSTSATGTFIFSVVSVSYQSGAACTNNSVSSTAVFTVNPAPSATISGTSTVCQNSSYNLTMNNPTTSNVTVTYNINGGTNQTQLLTPGSNAVPVTTSATGTFSYNLVSVQYTSGSPCQRTISGNAIVTVNPSPTVNVTGTQTVCQGNVSNNVVISNPQSSSVTVVYSVSGVGGTTTTIISGNNQATISNISTASAGTITYTIVSVAYTTGAGCINTNVGQSAVITVNPLPTVTSLAGNACSGTAVNYPLVSSPAGGTFTWYAQPNSNVTGETLQANQVTSSTINDVLTSGAGVTATVTYIVRPTVAGCVGTDYQVIITVSPPPTAPITGAVTQPTCATPTGSVALSGLPASGNWTVTASPGGQTLTGSNSSTGTFIGLAAGTYTFTVTSGCTSVASSSVIINAAPTTIATPTISGVTTCQGADAVFTITGLPIGTTVGYSGLSAGATPGTGFTTTTTSPTITVPSISSSQTLTITSLASGSCATSLPAAYTITIDNTCTPFGACNPIVCIVGDGSTALGSAAFQISIGEVNASSGSISPTYTTQFLNSNRLTSAGSSPLNSFINSYNGLLGVPGIDVPTTTGSVGLNANGNFKAVNILAPSTSVVNRVLFNSATIIPFNNGQVTSVIPITSTTFYVAGLIQSGSNLPGVFYFNGSDFVQITNMPARVLEIFNGNLYFSTSSGSVTSTTGPGIYQLGTGLPTISTTPTPLFAPSSSFEPYGFSISPDGCSLYIAIGQPNSTNRAISKYTKSGSAWTFSYKYSSGTDGAYGLVVDYSQTNPIIYATLGASYGTKIIKLIDNGAFTTTGAGWTTNPVLAPTNTRYSGIDFAPNLNPVITSQPTDITACISANQSTSVTASSYAGTLSYQWYEATSATETCGATIAPGVSTNSSYTPSVAGTKYYFCRVTVNNGTCKQFMNSRIMISILTTPPSATLTSASFCSSSNSLSNLVLTTTGSQTGATWNGGGLVGFNTSTGQFTPNASNGTSYTVTYSIPLGVCPAFSTTGLVTLIAQPTVSSIAYSPTSFCTSNSTAQAVTLVGSSGGSYTSTPAGLTISSLTGAITPSSSTAGTYTVTYTIPAAGGCTLATAQTSVTIVATPNATISYSGSTCVSNASPINPTQTGTAGGTYSASPSGLTITSAGVITPSTSTPGTYTVTYSIAAGICAAYSTTTTVIIRALPVATASVSAAAACVGTVLNLTGGAPGMTTYAWTGPAGVAYNANSSVQSPTVTMGSNGGTFTLTVTDANGCSNSATTAAVTVTVITPSASVSATTVCAGGTLTLTGGPVSMGSYAWTGPAGVTFNPNASTQSPTVTMGTVGGTFTLTVTNNGCSATAITASVTVNQLPTITNSPLSQTICSGTATTLVSLTSSIPSNYSWSASTASGITGFTASGTSTIPVQTLTNPSATTAGTVTYSVTPTSNPGGCPGTPTNYVITVNPKPTVTVNSSTVCTGVQTTVTATPNPLGTYSYTWTVPSGFTNPGNIQSFNTTVGGTYSVIISNSGTGCVSASGSGVVTVNAAPRIIFLSPP